MNRHPKKRRESWSWWWVILKSEDVTPSGGVWANAFEGLISLGVYGINLQDFYNTNES